MLNRRRSLSLGSAAAGRSMHLPAAGSRTAASDGHPMDLFLPGHPRLEQFRVLGREGSPTPQQDPGLKDTVQLPAGTAVLVRTTFREHLGKYAFHCHFLQHSSLGMMAQMEVVP